MAAYYNECDAFAAGWLRELIKAGLIAPGELDERSIEEVQPEELAGFAQCHFFAGIGVWSHALRNAGWADDSPVWTGSCPCQGFSASGKRGGFSDKRHLWPAWFRLIRESRPDTIFGEQVASNDGLAWLDVVSADLEGAGYAVGAADLCAAGFGAPHIRQRLYFVAESDGRGRQRYALLESSVLAGRGKAGFVADTADGGHQPFAGNGRIPSTETRDIALSQSRTPREAGWLADAQDANRRRAGQAGHGGRRTAEAGGPGTAGELGDTERRRESRRMQEPDTRQEETERSAHRDDSPAPSLTNGFWRDAIWLPCRDGKARPTQSGLFPLATGTPARVGRLRGYGNCLTAPVAEAFIRAYRGC